MPLIDDDPNYSHHGLHRVPPDREEQFIYTAHDMGPNIFSEISLGVLMDLLLAPGERDPWPDRFYMSDEPYDDGGGAAIAFYAFGMCVCA